MNCKLYEFMNYHECKYFMFHACMISFLLSFFPSTREFWLIAKLTGINKKKKKKRKRNYDKWWNMWSDLLTIFFSQCLLWWLRFVQSFILNSEFGLKEVFVSQLQYFIWPLCNFCDFDIIKLEKIWPIWHYLICFRIWFVFTIFAFVTRNQQDWPLAYWKKCIRCQIYTP